MAPISFRTFYLRPEDQLYFECEFRNVDYFPPAGGAEGQVVSASADACLILHFQTQHIAEQAFYIIGSATDDPLKPPGSVFALPAGPSQVAFNLPVGAVIPFTGEGLLEAIQHLPLRLSPVAAYEPPFGGCNLLAGVINYFFKPKPPTIAQPGEDVTALELPYRLILSPDSQGRWEHKNQPLDLNQHTELWHTRLESNRSDQKRRVRAIWSPDWKPNALQPHNTAPFRMSLDGRDRNELVHLTANWHIGGGGLPRYTPKPAEAENLMLSLLGGYLKLEGNWLPPFLSQTEKLTVLNWRHITSLGRDHYVRVLYAGYLFPWGHKAVLIKVSERKFIYRKDSATPGYIAYLFQRKFILVREPVKMYSNRDLPFKSLEIRTRFTPDIVDPASDAQSALFGLSDEAFWVRVPKSGQNEDYQFHLVGIDWAGKPVEFTQPLIFISENVDLKVAAPPNDAMTKIIKYFNDDPPGSGVPPTNPRRRRPIGGQEVAFAVQKKMGDTSLETNFLSPSASQVNATPHFIPGMAQAEVDIPAVRKMLGKSVLSTINYEDTYKTGGGSAIGNKGEVFAVVKTPTPLEFATEKVGGMVAPNVGISSLSRSLGPMGGPASGIIAGTFKPEDIFSDSVRLLGGIKLKDIIKILNFNLDSEKLPRFLSIQQGDKIRTSYTWKMTMAELRTTDLFKPDSNAEFILEAVALLPLDGSPPTFTIEGKLTNFKVHLLPISGLELVDVGFKQVQFKVVPDQKPDVNVDLGEIKFIGILEFVNRLASLIPLDGFSDPPILDITNEGLTLGYSLGLPTISIGVASLQNISFAASVFLPFGDKELNFHFAFCKREQPFTLTVYLFGGGGFFAIDVGIAGVRNLEAALEFGASVALDLGVARGKASIMGGFYFQMAGSDFTLTGYIRANGSLSVLGIISVSMEFYLSLTYSTKGSGNKYPGKLWGQCKITVEIEILFFSISVSVTMERQFAGSDPAFQQMISPFDWEQYCDAFDPAYPVVA
jgi:hypothetical protein